MSYQSWVVNYKNTLFVIFWLYTFNRSCLFGLMGRCQVWCNPCLNFFEQYSFSGVVNSYSLLLNFDMTYYYFFILVFLFSFWSVISCLPITFELIQDYEKWLVHELKNHFWISIRLNNQITCHKRNWKKIIHFVSLGINDVSWGRFHNSWVHGAIHKDSSIHLHSTRVTSNDIIAGRDRIPSVHEYCVVIFV